MGNNFDKDKVQQELDLQRDVTQEFDQNRKELRDTLHKIADSKRQQAEIILKENYIDSKNGYNTNESMALEASADKLDKATFCIDTAFGAFMAMAIQLRWFLQMEMLLLIRQSEQLEDRFNIGK